MKKYHLYQIDSFTKEKFTGNPAGVITNADGLRAEDMQKIARELNNSETAFVFSSDESEYEVHLRYFTPMREVPICGHATIAAHYARAVENKLETCRIHHKTGAGVLPVEIKKEDGDYRIIMTQGAIEYGPYIEGESLRCLLSAIGISEQERLENHRIQIVSTGHSKVMIGIREKSKLDRLRPNYDALAKLSETLDCNGYYVYTMDPGKDVLIHGRMFAPAIGINEDPVTGNANGPLGAYLVHHRLVKINGNTFRFFAKQGEAMGRAGVLEVEVSIDDGEPGEVKISGNAVIVFETEFLI